MNKPLKIILALSLLWPSIAMARPISYPGGWTVMTQNNGDTSSLLTHYSPSINYSIGLRNEYNRTHDYQLHGIQLNNLIKRFNGKNSQANIYLKSGIGYAFSDDGDNESVAGFTGLALDWEDRDYFASYENRYLNAGEAGREFMQSARVGITPYVGDFGDLHTWLMVQIDHKPQVNDNDHFVVTPLVRLFYDTHLLETGYSDNNKFMLNYIKRF